MITYITHAVKGWYNKYGQVPYYWVYVERKGIVRQEDWDKLMSAVDQEFADAKTAFVALLRENMETL